MSTVKVTRPGRGDAGGRPAGHGGTADPADARALRAFIDANGESGALELPPVAIVIAAYNEADGIGSVLDALPDRVCDLAAAAIVVVDGASDATARVAAEHGALVCDVPRNRGQGAALRLGYLLARAGHAEYIITTDADGQYDPAEMATLLAPLVSGEADFCTGSRQLGREETTDPLRSLGTRVFASVVSGLTGQHITDTSFGMRAMRAEVTGAVRLAQPQYQSSELLIGVIAHGYRVVERPGSMLRRTAGQSKKGHNLFYGFRYARVVLGTWLRERDSARRGGPTVPVSPQHEVVQAELPDEEHPVGS